MGCFSSFMTSAFGAMHFVAPKRVAIRDWRLALLWYVLVGGLWGYNIWSSITSGVLLDKEKPSMVAAPYVTSNITSLAELQEKNYRLTPGSLCTNLTKYDFEFDETGLFDYFGHQCVFLDPDEMNIKLGQSFVFVTTYQVATHNFRHDATGIGDCSASPQRAGLEEETGWDRIEYRAGQCRYRSKSYSLFVGAEACQVHVMHRFNSELGYDKYLPKTYVKLAGSDRTLHVFQEGETIVFDLDRLLDLVGVDLDKPWDKQPGVCGERDTGGIGCVYEPNPKDTGVGNSKGRWPVARVSGLQLHMKMRYYNHGLSNKQASAKHGDSYCVMEVDAQMVWNSRGHDVQHDGELSYPLVMGAVSGDPDERFVDVYRYGVTVMVEASGLVGRLNWFLIFNAFINGLVLMQVATYVVSILVCNLPSGIMHLYTRHIYEPVNWEKDFARYAVHVLSCKGAFNELDMDGSGEVSVRDLVTRMQVCLRGSDLSDRDLNHLAAFMVSAGAGEGAARNGTLNFLEFAELFAADEARLKDLKNILERNVVGSWNNRHGMGSTKINLAQAMWMSLGYEVERQSQRRTRKVVEAGGIGGRLAGVAGGVLDKQANSAELSPHRI